MWEAALKSPVRVVSGQVLTSLGGGNRQAGTYQIENFQPNPMDSSTLSKAQVQWGEEGSWLPWKPTWNVRSLEVQDTDQQADLRVSLALHEGRAELSVTNGAPGHQTELRFPLGRAESLDADELGLLADLRGSSVSAKHRETGDRQESSFSIADQKFEFSDGHLKKSS